MDEGLYERLVSVEVRRQLAELAPHIEATLATVDEAELPHVLSRHVADALARHITKNGGRELVNSIISALPDEEANALPPGNIEQLHAIQTKHALGTRRPYDSRLITPLSDAALLTNTNGEPALGNELRAELVSADRVDLLCAFVMWPGIRLLENELRQLRAHDAPIRVITSTYTGCTDRRTLDRLVNEFGAQVKVHCETNRTRLHAKAWLFRRNTGYDTGYVGSSNLSGSALLEGVEWNVCISEIATPTLMRKFDATFKSYWNDPAYETYDPVHDADRLDLALAKAAGRTPADSITLSGLQVIPLPHQGVILDQLEAERIVHGRHRNLVVAATGTGKTIVAALDYKRLCDNGKRPSLLFIAHRKEILEQARRAYAEVLGDPTFGEFMVDGQRPRLGRRVFASIQSLQRLALEDIDPTVYDVIVIDEFHHAGAKSYRSILSHFNPTELLGLTATPERGDGLDVRTEYFDGRTAAELRLWDALAADLLTPFHYFAVEDPVSLDGVRWILGAYGQGDLDRLYVGNTNRARHVLRSLKDKVGNLDGMKALAFCVSQEHARFMAHYFNEHKVPSALVVADAGSADRAEAVRQLAAGTIKVIFTVDIFNEGIDIPSVNTVLFLRPTESPTIFVQQLGRGLRLANNKPVLTAIDFVGHQRAEYRWDRKLRAIAKNMTRAELRKSVTDGFDLPGGSENILDEVAQTHVLESIKKSVSSTWRSLVTEARDTGIGDLAAFLQDSGIELSDVLRNDRSWTQLLREAGHDLPPAGPLEKELSKRVRALAHVDDPVRHAAYTELLADDMQWDGLSAQALKHADMLFFTLWPSGGDFATVEAGFAALAAEPAIRAEMRAVLDLALDHMRHTTSSLRRDDVPLAVHASYTREELLAAIGYASIDKRRFPAHAVAGVFRIDEKKLDALLITTVKTESGFSPTTMYRDYAISRRLFHWESQGATRADSATGQRYINHRSTGVDVLLSARQHKVSDFGGGAPFVFLGTAEYVAHEGERPMAVTWQLDEPMRESTFRWASAV